MLIKPKELLNKISLLLPKLLSELELEKTPNLPTELDLEKMLKLKFLKELSLYITETSKKEFSDNPKISSEAENGKH